MDRERSLNYFKTGAKPVGNWIGNCRLVDIGWRDYKLIISTRFKIVNLASE